jgi:hypothetical protein
MGYFTVIARTRYPVDTADTRHFKDLAELIGGTISVCASNGWCATKPPYKFLTAAWWPQSDFYPPLTGVK